MAGGKVILPVGADATIYVQSIDMGKKFTGQTTMQLSLTELSSGGKTYKLRNSFADVLGPKQAVVATQRGAVGGAIGAGRRIYRGRVRTPQGGWHGDWRRRRRGGWRGNHEDAAGEGQA